MWIKEFPRPYPSVDRLLWLNPLEINLIACKLTTVSTATKQWPWATIWPSITIHCITITVSKNMALQITRSCILAFMCVMKGVIVVFYHFICEHFKSKEILQPPGNIYIFFKAAQKQQESSRLFVKREKEKKKPKFPTAILFPWNFSLNELLHHDYKFTINNSRESFRQKQKLGPQSLQLQVPSSHNIISTLFPTEQASSTAISGSSQHAGPPKP